MNKFTRGDSGRHDDFQQPESLVQPCSRFREQVLAQSLAGVSHWRRRHRIKLLCVASLLFGSGLVCGHWGWPGAVPSRRPTDTPETPALRSPQTPTAPQHSPAPSDSNAVVVRVPDDPRWLVIDLENASVADRQKSWTVAASHYERQSDLESALFCYEHLLAEGVPRRTTDDSWLLSALKLSRTP